MMADSFSMDAPERPPSGSLGGLSGASIEKLSAIIQDDTSGAAQRSIELELMIRPIANALSGTDHGNPSPNSPREWQDVAGRTLERAKDVDYLLRGLLTTSSQNVSLNDDLPRIQTRLEEVEQALASLTVAKP